MDPVIEPKSAIRFLLIRILEPLIPVPVLVPIPSSYQPKAKKKNQQFSALYLKNVLSFAGLGTVFFLFFSFCSSCYIGPLIELLEPVPCGSGSQTHMRDLVPCNSGSTTQKRNPLPCSSGSRTQKQDLLPCGSGSRALLAGPVPCGSGSATRMRDPPPCGSGSTTQKRDPVPCSYPKIRVPEPVPILVPGSLIENWNQNGNRFWNSYFRILEPELQVTGSQNWALNRNPKKPDPLIGF